MVLITTFHSGRKYNKHLSLISISNGVYIPGTRSVAPRNARAQNSVFFCSSRPLYVIGRVRTTKQFSPPFSIRCSSLELVLVFFLSLNTKQFPCSSRRRLFFMRSTSFRVPGLGVYYTDPPPHIVPAGWDLDDLSAGDLYVDRLSIRPTCVNDFSSPFITQEAFTPNELLEISYGRMQMCYPPLQ